MSSTLAQQAGLATASKPEALPIVSIVVPFFGLTNCILRILKGNSKKELQWRLKGKPWFAMIFVRRVLDVPCQSSTLAMGTPMMMASLMSSIRAQQARREEIHDVHMRLVLFVSCWMLTPCVSFRHRRQQWGSRSLCSLSAVLHDGLLRARPAHTNGRVRPKLQNPLRIFETAIALLTSCACVCVCVCVSPARWRKGMPASKLSPQP